MHQDQDGMHRTSSQESGITHQQLASEFHPTPWDEFERRLKYDYSPIFKRSTKHGLQGYQFRQGEEE